MNLVPDVRGRSILAILRGRTCHYPVQVPNNFPIALATGAGVAMLVGCATSKEEPASPTASNRQSPGFVRLLNLSPESATIFDRGRRMCTPVSTNVASSFTTFPSGDRTIQIKGASTDLSLKMALKPQACALLVLGSDGKTSSTMEDMRTLENGHNLKLIYLGFDGSAQTTGPTVTVAKSVTRVTLSAAHPVSVTEGNWTIIAKSLGETEPLVVAPETVYDLVMVKGKNGRYTNLVLSHVVAQKAHLSSVKSR